LDEEEIPTRGIESSAVTISYSIQQTSDHIDLYDVRLHDSQAQTDWWNSEIRVSPITLGSIKFQHARRLAAGAFDKNISLANRWSKPDLKLSDEELAATLSEISKEWEQGIDDLFRED